MTITELFKTLEGIVILVAFALILITGAKVFAWLGLITYTLVNIKGGVQALKFIFNKVKGFLVNLLGKKNK